MLSRQSPSRPVRRLLAADRALAGIEFALIAPLLLAMLAGVVDLSLAFATARRLTSAAADVALIASTMAVQASQPNTLSGAQAWRATTAPLAVFPAWRQATPDNKGAFSITLSAVDFTPTPPGCTDQCAGYAAATRWSVAYPAGQAAPRPCGALAAAPDDDVGSMATLPKGVFGPTSLLVGDVSTVFTPLFTSVFVGPVTMRRSAYIPPRVSNGVQLTSLGPGQSVICPGQGS